MHVILHVTFNRNTVSTLRFQTYWPEKYYILSSYCVSEISLFYSVAIVGDMVTMHPSFLASCFDSLSRHQIFDLFTFTEGLTQTQT
jgi:hypothetical protein